LRHNAETNRFENRFREPRLPNRCHEDVRFYRAWIDLPGQPGWRGIAQPSFRGLDDHTRAVSGRCDANVAHDGIWPVLFYVKDAVIELTAII
jgi:hypothetical protein